MPNLPLYQDDIYIDSLLAEARHTPEAVRTQILDKAARFEGLTPHEVAVLLTMTSEAGWARVFEIAGTIKRHIYGDRVVMFAPLYLSDYCVNRCAYCAFSDAQKFNRRKLTMDEIRREVAALEQMGHKRLALEAGEDPANCPLDYVLEAIRTIYDMKTDNGAIRRVNVNVAAMDVDGYRQLKDAGIGTYILFQETYHRPTYEQVHLAGPKKNYTYHAEAFDRAMTAGIEDVGAGALFGLYDPCYETLALMLHNAHLEQRFGVGFHTISLPRIRKAEGIVRHWPHALSDETFIRIASVIRLAVPFTGIIISTRESPEMRRILIKRGVSQLSGGSAVVVGGYAANETGAEPMPQFQVVDKRGPQDILLWLIDEGLIPSFCTACYRNGRTGDRFMTLAKTGAIKNVCLPNALMTLAEYAADYGSPDFRAKAEKLISDKLRDIEDAPMRTATAEKLRRIAEGERDLYV